MKRYKVEQLNKYEYGVRDIERQKKRNPLSLVRFNMNKEEAQEWANKSNKKIKEGKRIWWV